MNGIGIDELKQLLAGDRYIISMMIAKSWYYRDLIKKNNVTGIVWTPYIEFAHHFYDEKSVEDFKMNFISPRKVNILRLK